jgi:hypothetical protein
MVWCNGYLYIIYRFFEYTCHVHETVQQLFVEFKKSYDSVRREVLYNIPIEFELHVKPLMLIKMYNNKPYRRVHTGGLKLNGTYQPLVYAS